MIFSLGFTPAATEALKELKEAKHLEKRYKAVKKALGYLQDNPRHPSLQTHIFHSLLGPRGEKVFEAYAEQDTPAAYRIFFYYGGQEKIVVIAITSHP
jgi:mRNA-degrading endonuclease RelE of RelBE toxin-antitoxin system